MVHLEHRNSRRHWERLTAHSTKVKTQLVPDEAALSHTRTAEDHKFT